MGEKSKAGLIIKLIMLLIVLGGGGLGYVHITRPDLSPFDGRLFLTVTFQRSSDLKPTAPIKYGETVIGEVKSVENDKDGKLVRVKVEIKPECKKYMNKSTKFSVESKLLGTPFLLVTVDDLNKEGLIHDAVVKGDDGMLGKVDAMKDRLKKGFGELGDKFNSGDGK
ncbi:MAG: MlaD family protein [Planctomycetota bacterium]|nr:MlaD family protein [Planctomycetota bacterium]